MLDQAIINNINTLRDGLFSFIEDGRLKKKFESFVQEEIEDKIDSREKLEEIIHAFLFDHIIEGNKTPIELYIEAKDDLSEENKKLLLNWKNSVHSMFKVNKVIDESFICYNLVNEKEYTIKTLTKFHKYRGIGVNNYIFCRVVPYEDYHILMGNLISFPSTARKEMLEMATMVQLENPVEMYKDNPAKLDEIYEINEIKFQKFYDLFGTSQVYTTGENLYTVLTGFRAYFEYGEKDTSLIENVVKKPEKFYFDLEKALQFEKVDTYESYISNYTECHDVALLMDQKEGLSILPYYATFKEIFSNPNFKEIPGYKECVMYFLEDNTVSPLPFVKVTQEYPVNSVNVFEDVMDHPGFSIQEDFDELMETYKFDYLYNNKLSSTVVFDCSIAFKELLEIYEDIAQEMSDFSEEYKKAGRNDPCPCGSGKKYKKCCIDKFIYETN